jgi:hypothetical protein
MTHDAERWVVLRRDREAGVIGGPDDGAGVRTASLTTWEVGVSCDHGGLTFKAQVTSFIDLLTAMTVLSYRHERAFRCGCIETDMAVARRALKAWRDEYGADPVIEVPR